MPILREKHSHVSRIGVFRRTWRNISIRCALNCSLRGLVCIVSRSMVMCSSPSRFDLCCSSSSLYASLLSPKYPLFLWEKDPQKDGLFPSSFLSPRVLPLSSPRKGKSDQLSACLRLVCRRMKQIVPKKCACFGISTSFRAFCPLS